jgi:hypothetical protein
MLEGKRSMRHHTPLLAGLLIAAGCCHAGEQTRIYSCVDAKGHRLTSDRPIMECLDREQQLYGESGTVRGRLPPALTPTERAAEEEKARQEEQARLRQAELKRLDRVLLSRYPDAASHERERAASLSRLDEAIAAGDRRVNELAMQRRELDQQSQVATKDIGKANHLKRALDENADHQSSQTRLLTAKREERQRIAVRFDEERARLQALWAQRQVQPVPVAATAAEAAQPAASRPVR